MSTPPAFLLEGCWFVGGKGPFILHPLIPGCTAFSGDAKSKEYSSALFFWGFQSWTPCSYINNTTIPQLYLKAKQTRTKDLKMPDPFCSSFSRMPIHSESLKYFSLTPNTFCLDSVSHLPKILGVLTAHFSFSLVSLTKFPIPLFSSSNWCVCISLWGSYVPARCTATTRLEWESTIPP